MSISRTCIFSTIAGALCCIAIPSGSASTVVSGLQPLTTYSFRVKVINSMYSSSYSNVAQATTEAFEPPRSLVAAPKSISEIDLTWTDASNGEAGFIVEQRLAPGGWMVADTVGENVNICSVGGLQPETQYEFRVMAFDGAVHSAYSNIASATTLPFPAPSNLAATAVTCTDIRLDWTDNTTGETGFIVEQLDGGSFWMPVDTLPDNATSCVIGGLQPSRQYSFRVVGANGPAHSKYSNTADAITLPFVAPTNLHATSVGSSSVELAWNDNTPFETGYVLESCVPPGMWTLLTTLAAIVTEYIVSGLAPSTDYSFRVKAVRGSVASDYSNTLALKTKMFLLAPTNFQAAVKSLSEAQLSWRDNSTEETGYEIEQSPPAGTWTLVHTTGADANVYLRSGLTPDSTYIFRIRAVAVDAASAWSEEKTVVMAYTPDASAGVRLSDRRGWLPVHACRSARGRGSLAPDGVNARTITCFTRDCQLSMVTRMASARHGSGEARRATAAEGGLLRPHRSRDRTGLIRMPCEEIG